MPHFTNVQHTFPWQSTNHQKNLKLQLLINCTRINHTYDNTATQLNLAQQAVQKSIAQTSDKEADGIFDQKCNTCNRTLHLISIQNGVNGHTHHSIFGQNDNTATTMMSKISILIKFPMSLT